MLHKAFALFLVFVALISVGALVAAAQADDPQPEPFAPGWMHMGGDGTFSPGMMGGRGMMGQGMGNMMGNNGAVVMSLVAESLGLEQDAFVEALHTGQTLAEIAEAQGVELQAVYDAMIAGAEAHMADRVAAGDITQEQADDHLSWVSDNIAEMPMFSGVGFGSGMMGMHGHGMMGNGMMGHGRGMGWNG